MIVLNFVLFLLIAVGQFIIYRAVQTNTITTSTRDSNVRDTAIARRLITIAVSDFLCWFPVGLLGFLSYFGTQISGEVNVAVAIYILPFNAAFNPFLYTFNVLLEKHRKRKEKAMSRLLEEQMINK